MASLARVVAPGRGGVGYVLEQGYDMPSLMLAPDEIEAAVLAMERPVSRESRLWDQRNDHTKRSRPTPATKAIPNWFQRLCSPQKSSSWSKSVLIEI